MLYQTHHPLFFQFRSTFPLSSPFQEMECVEGALKTGFRKEMALKSSPQAFLDDLWAVNLNNGSASEDFSVDELFDFSNGDGLEDEDETEKIAAGLVSSFAVSPRKQIHHLSSQTPGLNFDSGELVVPAEEEKHLEWLSHFVEDSNSEYSAPFPAGPSAAAVLTVAESKPLPEKQSRTCFKSPVPGKARSKRAFRTGGRVWCLTAGSNSSSSSSSTSSSSSGSFSSIDQEKPPGKKKRRMMSQDSGWAAQPQRRCSHCGVTKTPQWRAGPLGAKTLCNACGVRFKSGRLLPEYRPACSPTFSSELHSNHHRKVIEMRRKKEVVSPITKDLVPVVTTGVPSF